MFSLKEYVAQIDEFIKVNKGMSFASYLDSRNCKMTSLYSLLFLLDQLLYFSRNCPYCPVYIYTFFLKNETFDKPKITLIVGNVGSVVAL